MARGDVALCDLNPVVGTKQAGVRATLVLQIDRANTVSPHTIITPFTTRIPTGLVAFSRADSYERWWVKPRFRRVM